MTQPWFCFTTGWCKRTVGRLCVSARTSDQTLTKSVRTRKIIAQISENVKQQLADSLRLLQAADNPSRQSPTYNAAEYAVRP